MKKRFVAASLHFLSSALIISLFLSIVYFIWYPNPFYTIHSVFEAVKIILVVDLVLGPFLTLVIYNVKKPRAELVRDMSIIVLFQVSALIWGIHITYQMRPNFLVFQDDTFYSVLKEEIDVQGLHNNVTPPSFWQGPKLIYIEPIKGEAAMQYMDDILRNKVKALFYQADKYIPLTTNEKDINFNDVINHSVSFLYLSKREKRKKALESFLHERSASPDDYWYYPVENGSEYQGFIIFDKKDFSLVGVVD